MPVPRRSQDERFSYDPSQRAAEHLNDILGDLSDVEDVTVLNHTVKPKEASAPAPVAEPGPMEPARATAGEVRSGPAVVPVSTERESVRLLFITQNTAVRTLGSLAQKKLIELGGMFSEIHVLILNENAEETVPTVRLSDNVWLYSTESSSPWRRGFDAYALASSELIFAGVFRADIIVAEDPFESGAVAYALALKFDRPYELHLLEDVFSADYKEAHEHSLFHSLVLPFVVKRADGIRTRTAVVREKLIEEFPELAPITEVLPVYHNLEAWRDTAPSFSLRERYPQFNFIILHVSDMQTHSHTREVIQGVAPILRSYPTIGLVIIGNGPHRPALEKLVIALGIHAQVQFEPIPDETISHMKSANILIHLSEDAGEDISVLQAATVKLPILGSTLNISATLFKDGESAFICEGADPACVSFKLREFLRDNGTRVRFAHDAQGVVFERIEQDYALYLEAYRDSIERCAIVRSQVA